MFAWCLFCVLMLVCSLILSVSNRHSYRNILIQLCLRPLSSDIINRSTLPLLQIQIKYLPRQERVLMQKTALPVALLFKTTIQTSRLTWKFHFVRGVYGSYTKQSAWIACGDSGSQGYKIQLTGIRHVNKPHAECKQLLWVSATPAHGDGTSIHTRNILSITSQTISLNRSVFSHCRYCSHTHKHQLNNKSVLEGQINKCLRGHFAGYEG